MKEKKKPGEAVRPRKLPGLLDLKAPDLEFRIDIFKLIAAHAAFNRRYRSRQREEKE